MSGLRGAVVFLTVVPLPAAGGAGFEPASATRWFPIVGLGLGLLLSFVAAVLFEVAPPMVAGVMLLGLWVAATGALHLDGLADSADASFAPVPRDRRLDILQDPTHGTFAVVGIVMLLLTKFALLVSLSAPEAAAALLLLPLAGRASLVPAMRLFPPLLPTGMGAAASAGATLPSIGFAMGLLAVASLLMLGWVGLLVALVALAATLGIAAWLYVRVGGLNGDGYGAMIEGTEAAAFCALVLLVSNGHASATGVLPWA